MSTALQVLLGILGSVVSGYLLWILKSVSSRIIKFLTDTYAQIVQMNAGLTNLTDGYNTHEARLNDHDFQLQIHSTRLNQIENGRRPIYPDVPPPPGRKHLDE